MSYRILFTPTVAGSSAKNKPTDELVRLKRNAARRLGKQRRNKTMTYDEAMEGHAVSLKQAKAEVLAHGIDWADFVDEVGDKKVYYSNEILEWLGY